MESNTGKGRRGNKGAQMKRLSGECSPGITLTELSV